MSTHLFLTFFHCCASIFHQNHPPFTVKIKKSTVKELCHIKFRGAYSSIIRPKYWGIIFLLWGGIPSFGRKKERKENSKGKKEGEKIENIDK